MNKLATRQIHLDFHNSPYLPDICGDFDAEVFAQTMADAHVNSVTVFARCIHGMAYYPTDFGQMHPSLQGRDFLGEVIQALHEKGIRAPIYVTVTWEQGVAKAHPEWRQMHEDGRFAEMATMQEGQRRAGTRWELTDFLHPEYQDYMEGYLNEILDNYPVDGLFVDMLFYDRYNGFTSGWSPAARAFREEQGITGNDMEAHLRFEARAQEAFTRKFTTLIHERVPDATVFYNTPNDFFLEAEEGGARRMPYQTHAEIESLPSKLWGYQHFPRVARVMQSKGKPWLSMTGRFQKIWGDFGGIKPQPALEYECFRAQALGGCNSIGDQLLPEGKLDGDAYDLIGKVYAQCEEAEPFYEGTGIVKDVGILNPQYPGEDIARQEASLEAAIHLFADLRLECQVLDDAADLSAYALVVLPDEVRVDAALAKRLLAYVEAGGRLILSHRSGWNGKGASPLWEEWGLQVAGEAEMAPTYWLPHPGSSLEGLCKQEKVIYQRGVDIQSDGRWENWMDRVNPHFQRSDLKYCSHFQTPPSGKPSGFASVLRKGNVVVFSDPIFLEYRECANRFVKDTLRAVVFELMGTPRLSGLKETVEAYCLRKGDDLHLTLLHYIPYRKSEDCEVIEASQSFAGQTLTLDRPVESIVWEQASGSSELLADAEGGFPLPIHDGRLCLRLPGYFS